MDIRTAVIARGMQRVRQDEEKIPEKGKRDISIVGKCGGGGLGDLKSQMSHSEKVSEGGSQPIPTTRRRKREIEREREDPL